MLRYAQAASWPAMHEECVAPMLGLVPAVIVLPRHAHMTD